MGLKIWGQDPADQPKPRQSFADDVVGRFRSGYQVDGRPVALTSWRITTGDPEVADKVHEALGGEEPAEWEARGEDNLEVMTEATEVGIVLEGPKAVRQAMILYGRQKPIYISDGETITYPPERAGEADPDADLSFQERKQKGQDGVGPVPQIEVYFRLKGHEDLGLFKFQTGSWSLARDLAADDVEGLLEDYAADSEAGLVSGSLALEPVSFIAKNGPMKGKTVSYTKPTLKITGPASAPVETDEPPF